MNQYALSLGSNCEPRREHLLRALSLISQFARIKKTAPLFKNAPLLPENAPETWYQFFLNTAVWIETALNAREVLDHCQKIEKELGRVSPHQKWAPRTIDIDLIFQFSSSNFEWKTWKDTSLELPHPEWSKRNFVVAPLLHFRPDWPSSLEILKYHRQQSLPLTTWMPILNITPDSFSEQESESHLGPQMKKWKELLAQHPAVIDLGAESTRPGAVPVSAHEEWQRLEPFFLFWNEHKAEYPFTKISIDTRHAQTAKKALEAGATFLNDVTGLSDPEMRDVAEGFDHVIFMHSLSVPADASVVLPEGVHTVDVLMDWAHQRQSLCSPRLQKKIIFDPGIGFGKTPHQSLRILQNIEKLHALSLPLLVGHSRKSFMNLWTLSPFPDRDPETLGVSGHLFGKVEYLRIHNLDLHERMTQSLLAVRGPR